MSANDEEPAVAVALPASPSVDTQDAPEFLAQAAIVHNGSATGDVLSPGEPDAQNDTAEPRESSTVVLGDHDSSQRTEDSSDAGATSNVPVAVVNGSAVEHPSPSSGRSKVLPMPDEEPNTPLPPTPSTKRPPARADSLPPSAHGQSIVSPRPVPAPVDSAARIATANGRDSPALAPPTPGTPGAAPAHRRSMTMARTHAHAVPTVILSSALDTIAASREAKRAGPLKDSVQLALELVRSGEAGDRPRDIFEPLRLVCESHNEKLMVVSLDCISKLNSYSFFIEPHPQEGLRHQLASPPASPAVTASIAGSQESISQPSLVDLVVHTITTCHTEATADSVSVQIVKALLALITSSTLLVHQSSLLKAVRTVYNVFLLSTDPGTQTAAQAGLTQMVQHVFSRCRIDRHEGAEDENVSTSTVGESGASSSSDVSSFGTRVDTLPAAPPTPPADAPTTASPLSGQVTNAEGAEAAHQDTEGSTENNRIEASSADDAATDAGGDDE
jgi:brefeldin A-inhibited guanine nucleotide-exchange protein